MPEENKIFDEIAQFLNGQTPQEAGVTPEAAAKPMPEVEVPVLVLVDQNQIRAMAQTIRAVQERLDLIERALTTDPTTPQQSAGRGGLRSAIRRVLFNGKGR